MDEAIRQVTAKEMKSGWFRSLSNESKCFKSGAIVAFRHAPYCIQDSVVLLDPSHGLDYICEDEWNRRSRKYVLMCRVVELREFGFFLNKEGRMAMRMLGQVPIQ